MKCSRPANRAAVAQAVALLSEARQVAIFGIGASGILAEYTGRLFSRIGLPSCVLNRTGFSLAEQLISLQRGDVMIMMGQKSPHREGMTALREARRLGIPTILLTQAVDSRFSQEAQVVIDVPRGGDNGRYRFTVRCWSVSKCWCCRWRRPRRADHEINEAH